MVETAAPSEPYRPKNCGPMGLYLERVLRTEGDPSKPGFQERAECPLQFNDQRFSHGVVTRVRTAGAWGQKSVITYTVEIFAEDNAGNRNIKLVFDSYTPVKELDRETLDDLAFLLPGLPIPAEAT